MESALSYIFPVRNNLLIVVAVGNVADSVERKLAPQAIVRDVPLSKISTTSFCPCLGVPLRLVVMLVMLTANAVTRCKSTLSTLIDGVADDVSCEDAGLVRKNEMLSVKSVFQMDAVIKSPVVLVVGSV